MKTTESAEQKKINESVQCQKGAKAVIVSDD